MKAYRLLVQGECTFPDGGWRGFWVVREVRAEAAATAEGAALAQVRAGWTGQAHGPITTLKAVASWPVGFWAGFARQPASGHAFITTMPTRSAPPFASSWRWRGRRVAFAWP
jgi:hypothetical protein